MISKAKITRNHSARPIRQQWVFGAYDTHRKKGWIQLVPDRSAKTLLPIINDWCLPGSIIVSDGWRAYEGIKSLGFEHQVIVHEENFVDPNTGLNTNSVENYWQRCKRRLKRIYGTSRELLPTYLDEFLWLERYGKTITERWQNLFRTITINYQEPT